MSTTTIPVRGEVDWLCALALGLGYAAKPDEACAQELLTGANGSIVALRQARESLDKMAVTDPPARQRTCRILELVASQLGLDQPTTHVDTTKAQSV